LNQHCRSLKHMQAKGGGCRAGAAGRVRSTLPHLSASQFVCISPTTASLILRCCCGTAAADIRRFCCGWSAGEGGRRTGGRSSCGGGAAAATSSCGGCAIA
jgi:hypothetical protein